jgi:hypothetical protein
VVEAERRDERRKKNKFEIAEARQLPPALQEEALVR